MGAWGVNLNQNDVYSDVKDYYIAFLRMGKTNEEATKLMFDEFQSYINDEDDAPIFWFALAEVQWNMGRLIPEVKQKALYYIDEGSDVENWYLISKKDGNARKKVLCDLKDILNSPQPAIKKISVKKYKKCDWKDGDIYRYEFESETAIKYGMAHKFLFMQKCGNYLDEDPFASKIKSNDIVLGDVCPIVRLWVSDTSSYIPMNANRNECVAGFGINREDGMNSFRWYILNLPKKCDKLDFICNKEIIVPDNDFSIYKNDDIRHINWKYFEWIILDTYLYQKEYIRIEPL